MKGIVLELQQDLLSKDCDILNALRKAHIIATKLKLTEFDLWINQELNGYDNPSEVPEYRNVNGMLKAFNPYNGWIPTMIQDSSFEKIICERKMANSISSLIDLYNKCTTGYVQMTFPGETLKVLNNMFDLPVEMQFSLFISVHYIKEIIEHVKDCLLQWTLKLEEIGVIGENLSFTPHEKEAAQIMPQTINNYIGAMNVISAPVSNSQIVAGDNNSISFDYSIGSNAVEEIRESIEKERITQENKDEAKELLAEIDNKIKKKKKPSIIKSAFIGLKDFLISVGAGLTVAVIEAKMNGLF